MSDQIVDVIKDANLEEDAFMKLQHKPMKKWFSENPELREQYGRFPLFWQDLKDWKNWTEVKKIYIREKERKELKEARRRNRKTRWGDAKRRQVTTRWEKDDKEVDPGVSAAIASSIISIEELQILEFRIRMEELTKKISTVEADADKISNDPNRSPSPEPEYDNRGSRTNTRAIRMRKRYENEREEIMNEIVRLNPILKAIQPKAKSQRKIYFPVKEYPNYNFLGLVIGPRGATHRQLEQTTHCRIIIRGRGTGKEGKSNYDLVGRDEEPHCVISGENEDDVARCADYISQLCVPMDDDVNVHKQKQMRQLALMNGLHETNTRCPYCGMTGHDQFHCPSRPQDFANQEIRCEICGDSGHIARDCPNRDDKRRIMEHKRLNEEYSTFLDDLGAGKLTTTQQPNPTTNQAYGYNQWGASAYPSYPGYNY